MGSAGEDTVAPHTEVDWMVRISKETGVPVSFVLVQINDEPELWRALMDRSAEAAAAGASLHPQIAGRLNGILLGLEGLSPWRQRPSWDENRRLAATGVGDRTTPTERRSAILAETPDTDNPFSQFILVRYIGSMCWATHPTTSPGPNAPSKRWPKRKGVNLMTCSMTCCWKDDGKALLLFPFLNYADGNGGRASRDAAAPRGSRRVERRGSALRRDM